MSPGLYMRQYSVMARVLLLALVFCGCAAAAPVHVVPLEGAIGPASADFARPNSCDIAEDGSVLYVVDRETGLLRKVASGMP